MLRPIALSVPLLLIATAAMAHPHHAHLDGYGSFMSGLLHPFFGLDHVLAMVAVGLWASLISGRALFVVPAAFVGVMAVGFLMALGGVDLPFVDVERRRAEVYGPLCRVHRRILSRSAESGQ